MAANRHRVLGMAVLLGFSLSCRQTEPQQAVPPVALAAMRADFQLDGREASRVVVSELYARACEQDFAPACSPPEDPNRDARMHEMADTLRTSQPALAIWLDGHVHGDRETSAERRRDDARKLRRYEESCALGFGLACVDAAAAAPSRSSADRFNVGVDWCDQAVVDGCTLAASVAASRISPLCEDAPCAAGDERAIPLWTTACEGGDWSACTSLGRERSRRGTPMDDDAALTIATRACADGAVESCMLAAYLYDKGRILDCDSGEPCDVGVERASNGYSRGCTSGSTWSCTRLARRHRQGHTGLCGDEAAPCERSESKAYTLFTDACSDHDGQACTMAGRMARAGQGLQCAAADAECAGDEERALLHFTQACDGADAHGCFAAARLLQAGEGVDADTSLAARTLRARSLLTRSCFILDHIPSCRMLAKRHAQTLDGVAIVDGPLGWTDLMCTDGSCQRVCSASAGTSCTDSEPFPLDAG